MGKGALKGNAKGLLAQSFRMQEESCILSTAPQRLALLGRPTTVSILPHWEAHCRSTATFFVLMLRKYHKQLFFLTIVALFCVGCGFPYNTPEARMARRALRLQKLAQRQALPPPVDTTPQNQAGKMVVQAPVKTDTFPATIAKTDTIDANPNRITVVPADSAALDSLSRNLAFLDSIGKYTLDSLTALAINDSSGIDSAAQIKRMQAAVARQVRYSEEGIDQPVQYASGDSMIYDLIERKVYLYHNAEVYYEQYSLKAGYIEFNFLTNVATATCLVDSAGNEVECPIFNDQTQEFNSRRIEFNFKTKKGKVYDASTQQGDGYLVSNATKFISGDVDTTSSTPQNLLYSTGCLYTTCDAPHPHFGIRASKAKIIPGKLIVVGPSYVEVMGSPTPIILPFGFFPVTKNKRSGLILSMDFDFSPQIGPGIRGIGFYLGMSEYWDLKVTGDFYMRGSVRARAESQYNIRYKGSGNISIGYTRIQNDYIGTPEYSLSQEFNFNWTHRQAPQAHPSQSFSATVDFGTADFYQNTFNDANNVLRQTFTSNIGYNKRFLGTPFTLSVRASHSQNTQSRVMTINFPQFGFNMNQIFPFKRRKVTSDKERWYEKIGISYGLSANNTVVTTDTALFQPGGLQDAVDNMEYSMTHSPQIRLGLKLFDAINIEPSINYTQQWFFYRKRQVLDTTTVFSDENPDQVLRYGTVETVRDYGFFTTHDFRAGLRINTQIFATGFFNMGALRQVRAIITPSITANWTPGYQNAFDYYYDSVQFDNRYPAQLRQYNYFSFAPPLQARASLDYSLDSRLEAKVRRGRRDTTSDDPIKRIVLLPAFNFNGSYDITADSNHLSPIQFNTYTTLFKKLNLRFAATFDPYAANTETNQRIADWEMAQTGRLLRTTQMQFAASTSITPKDLKAVFERKDRDPNAGSGFDFLTTLNFQYNYVVSQQYINGVDSTLVTAHQLTFQGGVNLSKGWQIRVGQIGYSFKDQRITFPDFTFARDLHCWEMGLSWQPERQTWTFYIRAKPGSLGFLSVPVNKEFYETF